MPWSSQPKTKHNQHLRSNPKKKVTQKIKEIVYKRCTDGKSKNNPELKVSFSQSEAKIEAIMNDFIQLKPQSNVYDAETMVEGTLEGFSFDSEDEVDNLPKSIAQTDKNDAAEDQPVGKIKRAKKTSEHCLMGMTGAVRRSTYGHIIHANIDTDVIIAEDNDSWWNM